MTNPSSRPLTKPLATLEEVKEFLRIDHEKEDALIKQLIITASDVAVLFLGDEMIHHPKTINIVNRIVISHVGMMYDGTFPESIPYVVRNSYMSLKQPRLY